jgi:putative membrane protein
VDRTHGIDLADPTRPGHHPSRLVLHRGGTRTLIPPVDLGIVTAIILLGCLVGTLTGLLPGLHVNTVAPMVLAVTTLLPTLDTTLGHGTLAALLLFSVALTHTILNVIPTLAAPIPDGDESLVLLPIQRMAQQGRAVDALDISVRASWFGGLIAALVALFVLQLWPMGAPKIPARAAVWGVTSVVVLLVVRHPRPFHATVLFAFAGTAGWLLLPISIVGPLGGDGTILLPAFAGLFGAPLLLIALSEEIDPDGVPEDDGSGAPPLRIAQWLGTGCGLLVALFPGLTSATAGAVGRAIRQPANDDEEVAMLSAVDTANVVGNTAALMVWGATRSGASAAAAVAEPRLSSSGAGLLAALAVLTLILSTWFAAWGTLRYGPGLVVRLRRIDPQRLALFGLILLTAIVLVHSGPLGIAVAAALVPLGMLPHHWGVPRALLMGFLLVPYLASATVS